ncbi:MAG TPA: DUF1501 domain-containing protein [Gemmataceae bacterium]|nr:DUF1501 domain-containing protein [Gemmataceae bacterium]
MARLESNRGVRSGGGMTRRDFLWAGGVAAGLGLTEWTQLRAAGATRRSDEKACIHLFLVGGPSHLDTWDPKPNAPEEVRGPFRPIKTNVPGIQISEPFPLLARRADRCAIIRSVYHQEAPIHETGQQLMQTGRLCHRSIEWPHYGAVLSKLRPATDGVPSWVVLPGPIGNTGVAISHGQSAGFLGSAYGPLVLGDGEAVPAEPEAVRQRYGMNPFGQSCLLARRLIEVGVRVVTVNMFDTVFNRVTWDCHANGGDLTSTLADYRTTLCPMLDRAWAALLDDLEARGLLATTLVLCAGEFGRTPRVNRNFGRDHWPGCWSVLMAGGGIRGGQVIGASDRHGAEPRDRPVHVSAIAATVYHALGIDPQTRLPGADGRPLVEAAPVAELF